MGKFCSVKSGVFLRYFVKVDAKSVSKLADCYRYTAGTKVITLLNKDTYFLTTE